MNANKLSYEELVEQVAFLKEKLLNMSLLLSESYMGPKMVADSLENEKGINNKQLNAEIIESVFHKIKTPLDTITGLANLLGTSNLDVEERTNFAEIIADCSGEIHGIISELVSYSALEAQKEKVEVQKVSLNELLDDLKIKFMGQVLHKELSLRSSKGLPDGEDLVITDGPKITHIVSSLLSNSLKHTESGFVEVGYRVADNELRFYVKDSGIGLDEAVKNRLLASEFGLEKADGEGRVTGLGLLTVKRYLDLLGGSLHVESEPGAETVFSFKVPYVPAMAETEPTAVKKTIKVLIAEDEEISFQLLKKLLEKGKVQIIRAKNGEEAYEIYKNNPDINLVLMDLKMPRVDGYTAAQLIKNESPEVPIIAQSAYLLREDKENYGKAFNGYLSKPVKKKEFQEVLDKYIDVAFLN